MFRWRSDTDILRSTTIRFSSNHGTGENRREIRISFSNDLLRCSPWSTTDDVIGDDNFGDHFFHDHTGRIRRIPIERNDHRPIERNHYGKRIRVDTIVDRNSVSDSCRSVDTKHILDILRYDSGSCSSSPLVLLLRNCPLRNLRPRCRLGLDYRCRPPLDSKIVDHSSNTPSLVRTDDRWAIERNRFDNDIRPHIVDDRRVGDRRTSVRKPYRISRTLRRRSDTLRRNRDSVVRRRSFSAAWAYFDIRKANDDLDDHRNCTMEHWSTVSI